MNTYQTLQTEVLGWKVDKIYGELVLVADNATESQLVLKGIIGFEQGDEAICRVPKELYTNTALAKAVWPVNKKIRNQLKECNRKVTRWYWTPERIEVVGIPAIEILQEYQGAMYMEEENEQECGIRPIVFLKQGLMLKEVGIDLRANSKIWTLSSSK